MSFEMDPETELEELLAQNQKLREENSLFELHLQRQNETFADEDEQKRDGKKGKKKGKEKSVSLTVDQKLELAATEFEHIQKEIEHTKINSDKLVDTLKAVLEETEIRIADLKKDAYEFKRDIVVGAENFRTGKTMAEKVVRYMEEKLKQKDAVIEKLRLKNATLKSQIQKVDAQLKQKEEMGDVLHYIDFHQLQIENKQYVARIEERNQELLKLKLTTGNTVTVLNSLKKKLGTLISESEWLSKELQSRTDLLSKLEGDVKKVNEEINKEMKIGNALNEASEENSDMPHILDYVAQKAKMYELQSTVKDWERKIEIAAIASKPGKRRPKKRL